jgi:hypothetical protein
VIENQCIRAYLDIVRSGVTEVCREQILLADLIERTFATEDLFVDEEQLERYMGLQRYFPYELLPWEKFLFALHNCVYTAEGEDEIGNTYFSTLTLNPDGTYTIALDTNGAAAYDEAGTFRTAESMNGISIVLADAFGTESAGVVSNTLNITHNVDYAFNTLGFQYEKSE